VTVRDARPDDLPAVAAIYAAAAETTHGTFDFAGHPVDWWAGVLADPQHEFLVAPMATPCSATRCPMRRPSACTARTASPTSARSTPSA
jgi:hypothetical protein